MKNTDLFPKRKPGLAETIFDIAKGAFFLGKAIAEVVRGKPPKRVKDVFPHGTRAERAMREEGMSTIADEPDSFGPRARREDTP